MTAKPKRRAGNEYDLPQELWREILNRLPVKSILQCRSVCKSWYSLVSCPNFISRYTTTNLNKKGNRLLLQVCNIRSASGNRITNVCSYDESFMESCEHDDLSEPFRGQLLEIVGSCNGLICLSKIDEGNASGSVKTMTVLIWNPTIKKVVELPSRILWSKTERLFNLGFGFDSKTGDYKVMRSARNAENGDLGLDANVFEIFDLRKGVWRAISPPVPSWSVDRSPYPECYLDGAVHWIGYGHDENSDRILLSFNMRDELFREIRLPDCVRFFIDGDGLTQTRCVTFRGLIHLITWKTDEELVVDKTWECSVWAMKEYGVTESWTKLFNVDQQSPLLLRFYILDHFCLWKNVIVHDQDVDAPNVEVGDSLFFWDYNEILSYNIESKQCESVVSVTKDIEDVCIFEESLVLM